MAKDKKKNKKKTLNTSKQPVSMILIQNKKKNKNLTEARKERIYKGFRARALTKSNFRWRDNQDNPKLLRFYTLGTEMESTVEALVKVGSFKPIMVTLEGEKPVEIGFEVELKSFFTPGKSHRLKVLRKQFKATIYITL